MNLVEWALIVWSALAAVWWLIAIGLVASAVHRRQGAEVGSAPNPTAAALAQAAAKITVFKPLPPAASSAERALLAAAVESFVRQLEPADELLLGTPAAEGPAWESTRATWRRLHPAAEVRLVAADPRQHANPKVCWLEVLAERAAGDVWLWSDADVMAPPGFLTCLRAELNSGRARVVTSPYWIREIQAPAGMIDALFVNTEFLPGALLMRRLGTVNLAFGAGVLFRAEDFRSRVRWSDLGACLADDYFLGQRLGPVWISQSVVETGAFETRFFGALRHWYRWQKTIRWCRPGSFAALILIMPLLGWMIRCASSPGEERAWIGLGIQYAVEAGAAGILTALIAPGLFRQGVGVWLAWPFLRVGGWLAAWLPLPVVWQDPRSPWNSLRKPTAERRRGEEGPKRG